LRPGRQWGRCACRMGQQGGVRGAHARARAQGGAGGAGPMGLREHGGWHCTQAHGRETLGLRWEPCRRWRAPPGARLAMQMDNPSPPPLLPALFGASRELFLRSGVGRMQRGDGAWRGQRSMAAPARAPLGLPSRACPLRRCNPSSKGAIVASTCTNGCLATLTPYLRLARPAQPWPRRPRPSQVPPGPRGTSRAAHRSGRPDLKQRPVGYLTSSARVRRMPRGGWGAGRPRPQPAGRGTGAGREWGRRRGRRPARGCSARGWLRAGPAARGGGRQSWGGRPGGLGRAERWAR
jgi:hypothetical protein